MKNKLLICLITCVCNLPLCAQFVSTVESEINTPWLGFGYNQWPYSRQSDGDSYEPWDEGEWKMTEDRILAVKPSLVRLPLLMKWFTETDDGQKLPTGVYNKDGKYMQAFFKSMDLYKKHDIAVMTGFWDCVYSLGHDFYTGTGDDSFSRIQADLIDFLINEKGYTNIKYYTPENEPLGAISDFSLWSQMIKSLHSVMKEKNLPDILIGADSWGDWQWFPARDNKEELIGYDFHNYLNNTADDAYRLMYDRTLETFLSNSIQNIKKHDKSNKPIMVTEIAPTSVTYVDWPIEGAPPHCRLETYEYGLGFWDYGIQLARSGISTGLAWGLDGFQWNKNAGMWNNSGNYGGWYLRPWYYTWQLISRYFPADAKILKMTEPDNGKDVRIAGARIGTDDYSFVVLNRRKDATSKTQTITFKVPSDKKNCYVYYYNRSSYGDGISLSLPYTEVAVSDFSQEGITVEVPIETGVFITTLPPLSEGGKVGSENVILDFETEAGYALLNDLNSGISSQTASNPRKQEANMSDKVYMISQILPSDPFLNGNSSYTIITPDNSIKITEESPYLSFQCFRNGNNIQSLIGIKFVGDNNVYGSSFSCKSRTWSDFALDLSYRKGDFVDYIIIYPNRNFGDYAGSTTLEYMYVDNIQCVSQVQEPLIAERIDISNNNDILTDCEITFEYLSEFIKLSNSNNCGAGEIASNPRANEDNQSEKAFRLLQLGSKSNLEESNNFSVSLNPLYRIKITDETKHLHFQFFKMKSLSAMIIEIEFEGNESSIKYNITPDETRKWKTYSIDLSDKVYAIIKNITFYPNINFHSSEAKEDEETFIDNIILKNEPFSSIGEEHTNDKIKIYSINNELHIDGAQNELLKIYNLQGYLLESIQISDNKFVKVLPKGLYIVKTINIAKKIIIL